MFLRPKSGRKALAEWKARARGRGGGWRRTVIPRAVRDPAKPACRAIEVTLHVPHRLVGILQYLLVQVELVADLHGQIVLAVDRGRQLGETGVLVCRARGDQYGVCGKGWR